MKQVRMLHLREINQLAGMFYFSPDTMRFFRSRLPAYAYVAESGLGWYFVTSEQFVGSQGAAPRAYTVRFMANDGNVSTIGDFQAFKSRSGANAAAIRYAVWGHLNAEVKA